MSRENTNHPTRLLDWKFTITPIPFPFQTKPSSAKNQLGITPNTIPVCILHATHFILAMGSPCRASSMAKEMFDRRTNTMAKKKLKMYHDTNTIHTVKMRQQKCHAAKRDWKFQQTASSRFSSVQVWKNKYPALPNNHRVLHPSPDSLKKEL